jgi:hypothetical protein
MQIRLLFKGILVFAACASALDTQMEFGDMDSNDNLDEDEFETKFGLDKVTDPIESTRRREALKRNEEKVKRENEEFLEGNKTWWDQIDEFDDIPSDEFMKEKTGSITPRYGRGLIDYDGPESFDNVSERYFDKFRYSRSFIPESYSSLDLGNVSPVKNQGKCGSCVAFATMALIETCFKKQTGVFGDYSEQMLLDCGFGPPKAKGCNGSWPWTYAKKVAKREIILTHESLYPYKAKTQRCSSDLKTYNQGVRVTAHHHTRRGDEEILKRLVYEHGAVSTSIQTNGTNIPLYGGGIFQGCQGSTKTDHSVVVVGYGSENGDDYWLIKNSWGKTWGESGFLKLKRGVGMCGVGQVLVTVSCGPVYGPTDAPLTTEKPCFDKYNNCPEFVETNCKHYGEGCAKSCGLCPGMTPHASNTCSDSWTNCKEMAQKRCHEPRIASECCLSCGLGEGMTPVKSNTCYDKWTNCREIADTDCNCYKPNIAKECCLSCGLG